MRNERLQLDGRAASGLEHVTSAANGMDPGGLRGGIAVALALSLPDIKYKAAILSITYGVVLFSIIVQGLTVKPLVKRMVR